MHLSVFIILLLGYAGFGPLLYGLELAALETLAIFMLLNLVALYALLPLFMPWIAARDIRAIQAVLTGLKQGNFRVPIQIAPQPQDPNDENELNRLKRDIERMRASIYTRESMVHRQSERILKLNEALRREATTDRLTGLYNSRYFWERMEDCLEAYWHHGTAFSLALLDIDFFKRVNDTYGHLGGDRVLASLGALLRGNARDSDIAARLGGEEFVLILPGATATATASLLDRLHQQLRTTPIVLDDDRSIQVTASIGYTTLGEPGSATIDHPDHASPQEIVKRADEALYWVKRHGRDAVMSWDALPIPPTTPISKHQHSKQCGYVRTSA
ncbi:diguanylate cyclase [Rhabdochromatium marinum]|uniref:diguanylate cyclase n=1 Tax=Rhabdochromatium marinum TaxID=48729 RepID=UPI00190447C6